MKLHGRWQGAAVWRYRILRLVPLKPTTVRFPDDGMELVKQAAEKTGSKFGEFCREAAIMRAMVVLKDENPLADMDAAVREEGVSRRDADAAVARYLARRNQ